MTYEEVLAYLYAQLPMFHRIGPAAYKPDLNNTIALCEIIGNPQQRIKTVHVAGTNGKGSTSHLIASSLQEAGYTTGLCTSPHLKDFRERIKINDRMITREAVIAFVETFQKQWEHLSPSFFEVTIALSFWYFEKEKVDIAVIETGLGGRLDSTNVIQPELAVITNVGWDHMNLLGDTLEKIAVEKAGIIKHDIPVILGEMKPNVHSVIIEKAKQQNAAVVEAGMDQPEPPDSVLKGYYQAQNRRTAYAALKKLSALGWNISQEAIERGFQNVVINTGLMGRWQQLGSEPLIIADVAHNVDGISIVMEQLKDQQFDQLHFVIGMVNDKDISNVLALLPKDAKYYFCKADIPRGLDASLLQSAAKTAGLSGEVFSSVKEAYYTACSNAKTADMVFVGGSVFTVAEVL